MQQSFINIRIILISASLPCSLNKTLIYLAEICGKGVREPVCPFGSFYIVSGKTPSYV